MRNVVCGYLRQSELNEAFIINALAFIPFQVGPVQPMEMSGEDAAHMKDIKLKLRVKKEVKQFQDVVKAVRKFMQEADNPTKSLPKLPATFPSCLRAPSNMNGVRLEGDNEEDNTAFEEDPERFHTKARWSGYKVPSDQVYRSHLERSMFTPHKFAEQNKSSILKCVFGRHIYHVGADSPLIVARGGGNPLPHLWRSHMGDFVEVTDIEAPDEVKAHLGAYVLWLSMRAAGQTKDFGEFLDATYTNAIMNLSGHKYDKKFLFLRYILRNGLLREAPKWADNHDEELNSSMPDLVRQLRIDRLIKSCEMSGDKYFSSEGSHYFTHYLRSRDFSYADDPDNHDIKAAMTDAFVDDIRSVVDEHFKPIKDMWNRTMFDSVLADELQRCTHSLIKSFAHRDIKMSDAEFRAAKLVAHERLVELIRLQLPTSVTPFKAPEDEAETLQDTHTLPLADELLRWDTRHSWNLFKLLFNDVYTNKRLAKDSLYEVKDDGSVEASEIPAGVPTTNVRQFARHMALHITNSPVRAEEQSVHLLGAANWYLPGLKKGGTSADNRRHMGGVAHYLVDKKGSSPATAFRLFRLGDPLLHDIRGKLAELRKNLSRTRDNKKQVIEEDKERYDPLYAEVRAACTQELEGFRNGYIPPHFYEFAGWKWAFYDDIKEDVITTAK
eukprot:Blabericola_migrator_1__13274@NODE_928_length_6012_cov_115_691169_g645_i0_p1_GENE_NODE_928_length_6012_cov_115_691169_g645_i0NODE_928_length_6012_cov_115_691169_g645_i0_p1_ORF_typecomplete_len666_score120_03Sec10/PF07393_11/0_087Sec10/PF07393_11/3_7e03Vg_Tdu/PF07545_14/0_094_NODE_928_length_6012_cov_115_691169_g645_i038655862